MLLPFFALTYILSWLWFGAAVYILRCAGSTPSGTGSFIFLPGVIMPALVAIGLTARSEGRAAVGRLLQGILQWRVHVGWYVFAIGFMIAIKLVSAVLYRASVGSWPIFTSLPWYFIALAVLFSTPIQAGEEIGWRGFALPRLAERFGLPVASIVLGVIWAVWHLPFFYIPGSDNAGQSFPVFLIAVTAVSVAMAWLYWRTNQSLLLVMLMHAAMDNTAGIATSPAPVTVGNPFALPHALWPWLTALLLCVAGLWFLTQMKRQRETKEMRLILPVFL